jgi:hypothetical protein
VNEAIIEDEDEDEEENKDTVSDLRMLKQLSSS